MEMTIQGMQNAGVQATAKHNIGNEQETQRNPSLTANGDTIEAISANIDDRTMHELYLWSFADAVRAGTSSIMCSYDRVNSSYGCQNSKTLNGLLKDELGFQGYVMSDWGATHSGVASILAGLDMDMPGGISFMDARTSYYGGNLTAAVQNGSVPEARLDDMVRRIMTPTYLLGQDNNFPTVDASSAHDSLQNLFSPESTWTFDYNLTRLSNPDVRDNHAQLVRNLGAAGTVLLKNVNNALPLRNPKTLGIFGNDAGDMTDSLYLLTLRSNNNFEFGTLAVGGGSGTGRFSYTVPPLQAI